MKTKEQIEKAINTLKLADYIAHSPALTTHVNVAGVALLWAADAEGGEQFDKVLRLSDDLIEGFVSKMVDKLGDVLNEIVLDEDVQ